MAPEPDSSPTTNAGSKPSNAAGGSAVAFIGDRCDGGDRRDASGADGPAWRGPCRIPGDAGGTGLQAPRYAP